MILIRNMAIHASTLAIIALQLSACAPQSKKIHPKLKLTSATSSTSSGTSTLLLIPSGDQAIIEAQVAELGLTVEGKEVLKITGSPEQLEKLSINETTTYLENEPVIIPGLNTQDTDTPSKNYEGLYLAKKDMGVLSYQEQNPTADGRGVIVGVFDDGVSPHVSGFQTTSTGLRKVLNKFGNSSSFVVQTALSGPAANEDGPRKWKGFADETQTMVSDDEDFDLNLDNKSTLIPIEVTELTERNSFNKTAGSVKICIDLNLNQNFEISECAGSFSETGEVFLLSKKQASIIAEWNSKNQTVRFSQPEVGDDSHGEGVASVMAANNQAGIKGMSGLAPGAQILDYDLSEKTHLVEENEYTIGMILGGLEWLASNGAEVVNISYSLFFTSVESQTFMAKAIDQLVNKYNVVFSFSAGNNGPGLGSMNRRSIYPDSVLVVGAHVSKELDERVWGVTGLPEKGRVVYYSSRGPGPLGDQGPLLIAPLSSLTHSSPAEGFRAFNGTSSASPAAAGLATVFISALKQKGYTIHAPSVVHALRYSAQPIPNEPYIAQGYGMPNLERALQIYPKIIQGELPLFVKTRINLGTVDSIPLKGATFFKSKSLGIESFRVDLTAEISKLAPASTRQELLKPVSLQYSPGLEGAKELWVSASASRFHVKVNVQEMLKDMHEAFGEIKVIDQASQLVLAIIPVTAINDLNTQLPTHSIVTIGAQEGARVHLNIDPGTTLLKVRLRMLEGDSKNIAISQFNPHRIRMKSQAFTDDYWLVPEGPGYYQLGFIQNGGTERTAKIQVETEPLKIELLTQVTFSNSAEVRIRNLSPTSIFGTLAVTPSPKLYFEKTFRDSDESSTLEHEFTVTQKGTFKAEMVSTSKADLSYPMQNCWFKATQANGNTRWSNDQYSSSQESPHLVNLRCTPFDRGISGTGLQYTLKIYETFITKTALPFAMGPSQSQIFGLNQEGNLPPGIYDLELVHPITNEKVKIDTIRVQ